MQAPPDDALLIPFTVEPNYAGWTLADYVAEKLPRLPRPALERMLRSKTLVSADPALGPESVVQAGLQFALRKRPSADFGEPAPLRVLFDDGAVLVVEKPAGLPLHPTARYHLSTLTHALESQLRGPDGVKPDPAHRLDRETSGLLLCGRGREATRALKMAFAARQVEKSYLALCEGAPPQDAFSIALPLSVGTPLIKVKVRVDPSGAEALTECRVEARFRDPDGRPLSLIRCEPRTGRQHQLRAHLSAAGFPLVGDKLYGPSEQIFLRLAESGGRPCPPGEFDERITADERAALRLWRHALHADRLAFVHPLTRARVELTVGLPPELDALMATLRPAGP